MMGLSLWHILVVVAVIAVLCGAGKITRLARDLGSGINAFKAGLRDTGDNGRAAQASPPTAPDDPSKS